MYVSYALRGTYEIAVAQPSIEPRESGAEVLGKDAPKHKV